MNSFSIASIMYPARASTSYSPPPTFNCFEDCHRKHAKGKKCVHGENGDCDSLCKDSWSRGHDCRHSLVQCSNCGNVWDGNAQCQCTPHSSPALSTSISWTSNEGFDDDDRDTSSLHSLSQVIEDVE